MGRPVPAHPADILTRVDEHALTERLITYDTSTLEGMQSAAGFVKGWLEARDVEVTGACTTGGPCWPPRSARRQAPTVVLHGHLDVVPGRPSSSSRASRATASTGAAPTT